MSSRSLSIAVAVLLLALFAGTITDPVTAQSNTRTERTTQTLGSVRYYECAGEFIQLGGDYHSVFHVTFDPTGGSHIVFQHNSQGVSGVGLTSGAKYLSVGRDRSGTTNIFGAPGFEMTVIDTFHLVGQGVAADLTMRVAQHMTLTPEGEFSVRFETIETICR